MAVTDTLQVNSLGVLVENYNDDNLTKRKFMHAPTTPVEKALL
jgi:hypothetical protein